VEPDLEALLRASARAPPSHRRILAKRLLAGTQWIVESRLAGEETIAARYEACGRLIEQSEAARFHLGSYYDALLRGTQRGSPEELAPVYAKDGPGQPNLRAWVERRDAYALRVVQCYSEALCNGHKHIYHTLPRLLTLYCDYGAVSDAIAKIIKDLRRENKVTPGARDEDIILALRDRPPPVSPEIMVRTGFFCAREETRERMEAFLVRARGGVGGGGGPLPRRARREAMLRFTAATTSPDSLRRRGTRDFVSPMTPQAVWGG